MSKTTSEIEENIWLQSLLQDQLDSSERLLWWGRPRYKLDFQTSDFFIIPFATFWLGITLFWQYHIIKNHIVNDPKFDFFKLLIIIFMIPFLFVGLYLFFGRFYAIFFQRKRTYYGVTNERILIITRLLKQKTESKYYNQLSDIILTETSNNEGNISFIQETTGKNPKQNALYSNVANNFVDIQNPKYVYELILNAMSKYKDSK